MMTMKATETVFSEPDGEIPNGNGVRYGGFLGQLVNGRSSGRAYMAALSMEFSRRCGPDLSLDDVLEERGLSTYYYLDSDDDYWHVPDVYLKYRLNVKAIVHRLALWGYENAPGIYGNECYAEVVKGYPVPERPEDGDGWVARLLADPTCGAECAWEQLDGWNWAELLARRPQFAEFCAWDKLGTYAWSYLLVTTAAFDDRCDFSKFDGVEWIYLVKHRPELAVHLDWSILNDRDHARIEKILHEGPVARSSMS